MVVEVGISLAGLAIAIIGVLTVLEIIDLGEACKTSRDLFSLPWTDDQLSDFGRFFGVCETLVGLIWAAAPWIR